MLGRYWLIIALVIVALLVLYGPRLLPKLGRRTGKGLHDLKDASVDAHAEFKKEVDKPPEKTDT
jgi:Sec-independent protein translocase protein TatA